MRTPFLIVSLASLLAVGALTYGAAGVGGAVAETDYHHLPAFALHDCVGAEQSLIQNPFSPAQNDLLLITTYEEFGDVEAERLVGETPEGRDKGKVLNAYLILRVSIVEDLPGPQVHEAVLMVAESEKHTKAHAAPALREWKLLDADGDGQLDRGSFSAGKREVSGVDTGVPETSPGASEMEIPSEELPGLQGYFDEAIRHLSLKAADGPGSACTLS